MKIQFKKLRPDAVSPAYSKPGDAGLDLTAVTLNIVDAGEYGYIEYGTGIAVEIPEGYVGLIFPRSSISITGMILSNSVGVIDCVPAGTKIQTPIGEIEVEKIYGSNITEIYSFNEDSESIEFDSIVDMWIVNDLELLTITVEDTTHITVPVEKEIFTDRGWIRAKNLTQNDSILSFK